MPRLSRRNLLAIGAVSPLVAACGSTGSGEKRHVAVIGAGIIGASIAYHLAKGGAQVTVIERHDIATRASRGTFAWLNATWAKQPRNYHRLNQLGLAAWQELEAEIGIPIKWGGSLEWFGGAERQELLGAQIAEQAEWGEPARMIGPQELASLEPQVVFGGAQSVAYSPNDGALDPVLAARTLLNEAQALGAVLKTNCAVTGARAGSMGAEAVLETDQGDLEVDSYVLATGADPEATQALAGIDIPQRSTPGVIVVTQPMAPMLGRILVAPGVHVHQRLDGRVVLGEQDGAPQNEAHAARLADRPNAFPTRALAEEHAARILAIAQAYLPALADAATEDVFIGWRPLPLDGHPVMGFSPQRPKAYLAITHSGVSLAPILGRLAAQELLEETTASMLEPYRPDRAFEEVRRY
ncbi:FAD-dependent oxidoreductase [uncultured Erythrobacter sp.]|uniref:NAD(P)/FAD-dependent oxidoreductase n=1 Tax=uncultured Erythrobacter sp. TaxID=263913 RepID=UPI002625A27E|nr:FAD-dependent oxidoreductase [uncultured Erythrobacter sp.]